MECSGEGKCFGGTAFWHPLLNPMKRSVTSSRRCPLSLCPWPHTPFLLLLPQGKKCSRFSAYLVLAGHPLLGQGRVWGLTHSAGESCGAGDLNLGLQHAKHVQLPCDSSPWGLLVGGVCFFFGWGGVRNKNLWIKGKFCSSEISPSHIPDLEITDLPFLNCFSWGLGSPELSGPQLLRKQETPDGARLWSRKHP